MLCAFIPSCSNQIPTSDAIFIIIRSKICQHCPDEAKVLKTIKAHYLQKPTTFSFFIYFSTNFQRLANGIMCFYPFDDCKSVKLFLFESEFVQSAI